MCNMMCVMWLVCILHILVRVDMCMSCPEAFVWCLSLIDLCIRFFRWNLPMSQSLFIRLGRLVSELQGYVHLTSSEPSLVLEMHHHTRLFLGCCRTECFRDKYLWAGHLCSFKNTLVMFKNINSPTCLSTGILAALAYLVVWFHYQQVKSD